MRLTIAAMERRYGRQLEVIYLLNEPLCRWSKQEIQQTLGRNVEAVALNEMVRSGNQEAALAGLGALFGQDAGAPPILTNFRTREFSYLPPLREILSGLRSLLPLFLGTLLLFFLALIVTYVVRAREISYLKGEINSQINRLIPSLALEYGNELTQLSKEIAVLDDQLKDLGSPNALSPLDALQEFAADFPASDTLFLQQISIRGTKMKIDGNAPDYATVEKLEKKLKQRKNVYCRIKKDSGNLGSAVGGSRTFSFEIILCD
jgi:hypothetical protein